MKRCASDSCRNPIDVTNTVICLEFPFKCVYEMLVAHKTRNIAEINAIVILVVSVSPFAIHFVHAYVLVKSVLRSIT